MNPADQEAERLTAQLEGAPDDFPAWLQLARLHNAARRSPEALEAANNALTLMPQSLEALFERGIAQLDLGLAGEAAGCFSSIIAIQPLQPGVLIPLGSACYQLRRFEEAAAIWEQAVRVAPDPMPVLEDLAVCYQRQGDFQKVADVWERVLLSNPSHPQALHHLGALGRRPAPDHCSDQYLIKVFDEFAPEFDATLAAIGYDAPRLLAELVATNTPGPRGPWRILDAGCGTGLCAEHIRVWATRLEGVDIAPQMVVQARLRNSYDELHCAEMARFCGQHPSCFDLVVAADSLTYHGRLEPVVGGVARCLRDGGRFVFFVELREDECADDFRLEPHGRYSHQPAYVERCLAGAGLRLVARTEAPVRSEAGRPVRGGLFLAQC